MDELPQAEDNSVDNSAQRYPHPQNVYRSSWGNAWFVQLRHRGERWYLGSYRTMEEAVEVRDAFKASA